MQTSKMCIVDIENCGCCQNYMYEGFYGFCGNSDNCGIVVARNFDRKDVNFHCKKCKYCKNRPCKTKTIDKTPKIIKKNKQQLKRKPKEVPMKGWYVFNSPITEVKLYKDLCK
jgi:hypothetical protein